MNKLVFLVFLLIVCNTIYSQNEINKDSLKIRINPHEYIRGEPIINQESLYNSLDMGLDNIQIEDKNESKLPDNYNYKLKLTPDLIPRKISSNLSYSLNEYNYNYGIGNYRQGGIELLYKPLNKLTISMGGYAINYNILHGRYNDIMFDFNATFEINDKMFLTLFGQHSVNSMHNAGYGGYMFSPQPSYGAKLKFKTSEKVDLNIGVERSFNSMTKQWKSTGILAPSIRLR